METAKLESGIDNGESIVSGQTRVINGEAEATSAILSVLSRAKTKLDVATNFAGPSIAVMETYSAIYPELKAKGIKVRFITEITEENLVLCERIKKLGADLRHLDGLNGNVILNETEYLGVTIGREGTPIRQVVHSLVNELVEHEQFMFETLWKVATPARSRIDAIEHGTQASEIKIISDVLEIADTFLDVINHSKYEIKIVFPTMNAFHRAESIGVIEAIEGRTSKNHIEARILSPLDLPILERAGENHWHVADNKGLPRFVEDSRLERKITLREVDMKRTETNVTIVIVDGGISLVYELRDDSTLNFGKAVGLGIYSNSRPTVMSYLAFFEKLWDEMDLSEREARSRRQAELLQDILTHDIRNYNQVSLMAAELIQDRLNGDRELSSVFEALLESVKGSTQLVKKAQSLGRIIAEGRAKVSPIDLTESIKRSLALVKSAYPSKHITVRFDASLRGVLVLADDLVDEIFVNIFANAAKHGGRKDVEIDIRAVPVLEPDEKYYCAVSIADNGKGIPDEQKVAIFERYSRRKKGNGLGMSIVHALAVGRYGGKASVRNNKPSGSIFEITLPAIALD